MKQVFIDTYHFVASFNANDELHAWVVEVEQDLGAAKLVTSEMVLAEVLNYFSAFRYEIKQGVVESVLDLLLDDENEIILHTHDAFLRGAELYAARLDKGYSLTDCISMNLMRERGITDVLTHDHHFTQEGFNILL
jgi:uncharacterized protein